MATVHFPSDLTRYTGGLETVALELRPALNQKPQASPRP